MEGTMKLTCYAVALVLLFACSAQMVRAHLNASTPLFWPDLAGCIPATDVQWVAAFTDHDGDGGTQVGRPLPPSGWLALVMLRLDDSAAPKGR
jgi:hypothetical protein